MTVVPGLLETPVDLLADIAKGLAGLEAEQIERALQEILECVARRAGRH